MILKGSQRGGGRALAAHLLNLRDNDHLELLSIDGLIANDVTGAFLEIEAVSRATRCKQTFFSLSLSPPKGQMVTIEDFRNAIDQAAERLGLTGQPRAVIFHEKEARHHCHVVWSRIDVEEMKAVNLPFYKERLNSLARELYLSHGWQLPKGLADHSLSNPLNFGLTEWQEAKRAKRDPREIKAVLKQCWEQSDSAASFAAALKDRGFWLCKGDRRGFVALDYKRNIYSLSRWLDVNNKALKMRLGEAKARMTIEDTCAEISSFLGQSGSRVLRELEIRHAARMRPFTDRRLRVIARQRQERCDLRERHHNQLYEVRLDCSKQLRGGIKGMFDWFTGRRKKTIDRMKAAALQISIQCDTEKVLQRERNMAEREALLVPLSRLRKELSTERYQLQCLFTNEIFRDCSRISNPRKVDHDYEYEL